MENLVEEVERVAESGNLKVGLTKAVSGAWPWQDHSHTLASSWSTWSCLCGETSGRRLAMCWRSSWALFKWTSRPSNFLPSESSWI